MNQQEPQPARYYTNSELWTARRCRRRWWLTYYRQLRRRKDEFNASRTTGVIVHDALAVYYETGAHPLGIVQQHELALKDLYEPELTAAETPDLERELVDAVSYAAAIVTGYVEWLAETGADQGLRLIATESEVAAPLRDDLGAPQLSVMGDPIYLLGKLDARFEHEELGFRFFMDHKVVPDLVKFPKWAHLSPQMLMYHLIEYLTTQEHDPRMDGGVYNLLRKSKRTARAKPPFYARHEVRHNLTQLRNYYIRTVSEIADVETMSSRLQQGEHHLVVCPPNPDESCTWQCPFFSVCGMLDDGSDAEGYLAEAFEPSDPLERYTDIEKR